jgi:hypothetical protein
LKIKLKDHHFDTVEVMEAKSQVVLIILTEHDFQGAFKKITEAMGMVRMRRRGLLEE